MSYYDDVPRNPISVLHEYCQQNKIDLPKFKEGDSGGKAHCPRFEYTVFINETYYGPAVGSGKMEAKTEAAIMACEDLGLYHTGQPQSKDAKKRKETDNPKEKPRNDISILFEYAQVRNWPKPKDKLISEEGPAHEKYFSIRYSIAERDFPVGSGLSKDVAKRRAAARALCQLKDEKMRDHMRGPDPDRSFGDQVAEFAWEAFGVLCEELGEDLDFCMSSDVAAFVLENLEDGSLRVVSLATGMTVATSEWRAKGGETIIDSHAVIVARRNLLLFIYDQLIKLLGCESSIFEFGNNAIARLKDQYEFHLYMRFPPCGESRNENCRRWRKMPEIKVHKGVYQKSRRHEAVMRTKPDCRDVASCSDKIMLWNTVGLQGALLSNFVPNIYLDSITVSDLFDPHRLTSAFCCRIDSPDTRHPWIQQGTASSLDQYIPMQPMSTNKLQWSIYWTHAGLDLEDTAGGLEDMLRTAGIVDGVTGRHLEGTSREGTVPPHCKRNLFLFYRKLCKASGANFASTRSYLDHKNRSVKYRTAKNEFFKRLDKQQLGRFPIMDRNVDNFSLPQDDGEVAKSQKME